jgi:uncharacterized membrane protein
MVAASRPEIRRIDGTDVSWALAEGWRDFKAKRGDVIVLALLYPLAGLLAAAAAFDDRVLPLVFPLVAGLSIVGPAVATGFYELARRREAGLDSSWLHFIDPLKGRSRMALAALTAGLVVLFLLWLLAAEAIFQSTLASLNPIGLGDFLQKLVNTPEGIKMIVEGNLAGGVFAVLTLILTFVSFPMIVDKPVDAGTAIQTSLRAFARNPATVAGWGVRVAALLLLGCLPAFMGLPIVLPVLGYATWHLYTRLVVR